MTVDSEPVGHTSIPAPDGAGRPRLIIGAVGDVLVDRSSPTAIWQYVKHVLHECDILFGNCEGVYTDRDTRAPSAHALAIASSNNIRALGAAGFTVMAGANNHIVDAGHEGLIDTLLGLHRQGIQTCGFGNNLDEARRPAIVDRNGVRVAFIAYSCVYPTGYQARAQVPGLAPIRVHTIYQVDTDSNSPGAHPDIVTIPYEEDIDQLCVDIENARQLADLVIASFHWGEANVPATLHNYEHTLAHVAIDRGADAVLGHHHHVLRAVEVYRERPIFYGLGHFVFDLPNIEQRVTEGTIERWRRRHGEYALGPRAGWPLLPFHPDARKTMLACLILNPDGRLSPGVIPCSIIPDGCVVPHDVRSAEGKDVINYLERVTSEAGISTSYVASTELQLGGYPIVTACPTTESNTGQAANAVGQGARQEHVSRTGD